MERLLLRSVWRNFNNRENGPFNVNLDNDLENRKSLVHSPSDLISNIGARVRSSLAGRDIMVIEMSNLQLLRISYDLMRWIYPTLNKFPKSQRLILSQRIELLAISILGAAVKLNYLDDRATRKNAVIEIHKLQVLLRVSKDMSFLDLKKYEYASKVLSIILKAFGNEEKTDENLHRFIREDMQV